MANDLASRTLAASPSLETRELRDGTRLVKQTTRVRYLALPAGQQEAFDRFDGTRTVSEVLQSLLKDAARPIGIRQFHELVTEAIDGGFLVDAKDTTAEQAAVPGHIWPVHWPLAVTIAFLVVAVPLGGRAFWQNGLTVPDSLFGWFVVLLWASLMLSLASILSGAALSGFGRCVYGPGFVWNRGLPVFTVNLRDAFMGGRPCQAAVALQALAAPFIGVFVGSLADSQLTPLAGALAALVLAAPFGQSPVQELLHALFRRDYALDRCAAGILGRRLWRQLVHDSAREEGDYLFVYSIYSLVWLAGLVFLAGIMVRQGGFILLDRLLMGPDLATRLSALLIVALLAVLLLAPIVYQLWLVARNVYEALAPHWFKAEAGVRRRAAAEERPQRNEITDLLSRNMLFSRIPSGNLGAVADVMTFAAVKAGTTIIREGDIGESLFVVYSGRVEVVKETDTGQQRTVAELGQGGVFGEIALLDNVPRTASVRAATETAVLSLFKADFESLLVQSIGVDEIKTLVQVCAYLKRHDLFADWSDAALVALAHEFRFAEFAEGAAATRQGESHSDFYVVYEGTFGVVRDSECVATLGAGEFFGEISLLAGGAATADVIAREPSRCLALSRERFLAAVSSDMLTGALVEKAAEERGANA